MELLLTSLRPGRKEVKLQITVGDGSLVDPQPKFLRGIC